MFNKSESQIWSYIGKIGVIVAILWGSIQIINFFVKSPEYSADIKGKHSYYETSPWHFERIYNTLEYKAILSLFNRENKLLNNLDLDSLLNIYKDKKNIKEKSEFDEIIEQMNEEVNRDYNTIWIFDIKNNGNKTLEDLILEMPYLGYYKVLLPDNPTKVQYFEKSVKIGNIRPSNLAKIYCWTNLKKPITKVEEDSVIFTHKNGVCNVFFPTEINGIYELFYKENGYYILIILMFVTTSFIFYLFGKKRGYKKRNY